MAYEKELAFAKKLAHEAGAIMKKYYRGDQCVEIKSDNTPVTIADTEINALLIDQVKVVFPEDGVLGEEASWETGRNRLWVCDPIDGTPAFVFHIPTCMFSLALVVNGRPVVAVAYNAFTDDMYEAVIGEGASCNDCKINVSKRRWDAGLRLAGSSDGALDGVSGVRELKEAGIKIVHAFGAVFKGCLIAEGSVDGRLFMHTGAHDIAAIKLIIEEAGGKVTDLDGNEQRYDQPINGAVMSNGLIHDKLLEIYANSRN